MKTKITDLREHLFLTLEGLLDDENPMDLKRAQAVADVGRVIVDSAKVEVDMAKVLVARMKKGEEEKELELIPSFFNDKKRLV